MNAIQQAYTYLAAAYGQLNRVEQARNSLARADLLRAEAGFGPITEVATAGFNFRWRWHGDRTALKEGLAKAGAPKGGEWLELVVEDGGKIKAIGATTIDAAQAMTLHKSGAVFVDTQRTWLAYRIPGAHFLEWVGTEGWLFNEVSLRKLADYDQALVIYRFQSGGNVGRIAAACAQAVSWGFTNVYCFPDGLEDWKSAGYTIDTSKK